MQLFFFLLLFRMLTDGGAFPPPTLKAVTYVLQWWNFAQLYLPKEDPKNI